MIAEAWTRALRVGGLLFASALLPGALRAATYSEDAVKAAFLYRFAAYVEWPLGSTTGGETFKIAVVGADGVAAQLERLLPGLNIKNHPAQLMRITRPQDLDGVQILYIGPVLAGRRPLLTAAAARPILVVTDEEGGLASGATINFVEVGNNVRFEVSLPAAERSRLKINAELLAVAARVDRGPRALLFCLLPLIPRQPGRNTSCAERLAHTARPGVSDAADGYRRRHSPESAS